MLIVLDPGLVWLSEPRYKQQLPLSDSGGSDASHEGQKLGKVVLTTLWGRAGLVLEAKLPLWGLPRLFCSSSLDEALAKLPNSTFSLERFHCRAAMIELKSQLTSKGSWTTILLSTTPSFELLIHFSISHLQPQMDDHQPNHSLFSLHLPSPSCASSSIIQISTLPCNFLLKTSQQFQFKRNNVSSPLIWL